MSENLTVTLSMSDWELAGFNTLCEEHGYSPSDALTGFAKWCAEYPAQAKDWLMEDMIREQTKAENMIYKAFLNKQLASINEHTN